MIKFLPERQYQLAAQKKHKEFLKLDYHNQVSKYYERESAITKKYNSWLSKDSENTESHSTRSTKNANLQERRKKLQKLFKKEEQQFKKELDNLERSRKQFPTVESSSLESLKQKLLEKRSEESLYLPNFRKRSCSAFENSMNSASMSSYWERSWSGNGSSSDSITRSEKHVTSQIVRSLEGTNLNLESSEPSEVPTEREVTGKEEKKNWTELDGAKEVESPRILGRERLSGQEEVDFKEKEMGHVKPHINPEDREAAGMPSSRSGHGQDDYRHHKTKVPLDNFDENPTYSRRSFSCISGATEIHDSGSYMHGNENGNLENSRVDNKVESRNPMFVYLLDNESKVELQDLRKKELHACQMQNWYDALRLRSMGNKLQLEREKNMMKEDLNALRLDMVEDRWKTLKEREDSWLNSVMYSDESRSLLQKWMIDDEEFQKHLVSAKREKLMADLEKEWKNLSEDEKKYIEYRYQEFKKKLSLQEGFERVERNKNIFP